MIPERIIIGRLKFYCIDDLFGFNPDFFEENKCSDDPPDIIKRLNIQRRFFCWANHRKNEWTITDEAYYTRKAKLLLADSWVLIYMPKMSATLTLKKNTESEPLEQIVSSRKLDRLLDPKSIDMQVFVPGTVLYLIIIGKVKHLRKSMMIDGKHENHELVCKIGRTKNISERVTKHISIFGKFDGARVRLRYYVHIKALMASIAEADLIRFLLNNDLHFAFENTRELIIATHEQINTIIASKFLMITENYGGFSLDDSNFDYVSDDDEQLFIQRRVAHLELDSLRRSNYLYKIKTDIADLLMD
jgi:hypothetical protein